MVMKHPLDIWMNSEHIGKWMRSGSEQSFKYMESYLRDPDVQSLFYSLTLGPVSIETFDSYSSLCLYHYALELLIPKA
jgi:HipA-like protein